ncbi:flavin-binding family monooxygenase domain protein, partial [Mycobacterium xenopi 3993]
PDPGRRPLRRDQRRTRRSGHRSHRPLRHHRIVLKSGRIWTPTSSSPPLACSCRRWASDAVAGRAEIKPQDRFVYKAHMLEDVPNLFWCGLHQRLLDAARRHDRRATAKLLAYMNSRGYTHAYAPRRRADAGKTVRDIRPATCCARCTRCPSPAPSGLERAPELLRRRHRLPVRPDRGGYGVRARPQPPRQHRKLRNTWRRSQMVGEAAIPEHYEEC